VYTSPARGHLYPVVPIAQELAARGHEIALRTLASQVQTMRELQIDAEPVSPDVERVELEDYRARSPATAGRRAMATFAARAAHEAPDLTRAIEGHRPDALLIDINCWGAATVAQRWGMPWAMYSPYLLMLPSREAPPFGLGLAPRSDALGIARDAVLRSLGRVGIDRTVLPSLNRLRTGHGLRALRHFDELFAEPSLLLALTAEGFEYPRNDWPENVRFVGPMSWSPPDPSAKAARELLASMSDPLVLVTCSTELQRDKRLLHVALQSLPAAGMSVIATTAAHDPAQFTVPAGSRVERFLPHDPILERTSCVVCHGGMGITQKALAAKVPVVVVPFGRDQLETARRVEVAEAGVRLSPRRLTPDRLAAAVATARECRAGAQCVSRAYAATGGQAAAADAIEAVVIGTGQRMHCAPNAPNRAD
jgi:MGT family glycosyltransferase